MSHEEGSSTMTADLKKQQRLAAWRQKQQQQQATVQPPPQIPVLPVKVSWNMAVAAASKQRNKKRKIIESAAKTNITMTTATPLSKKNPFDDDGDDEGDEEQDIKSNAPAMPYTTAMSDVVNTEASVSYSDEIAEQTLPPRKRNRWDTASTTSSAIAATTTDSNPLNQKSGDSNVTTTISATSSGSTQEDDTLDQFMAQLHSVAADDAVPTIGKDIIHLSGSVQQPLRKEKVIVAVAAAAAAAASATNTIPTTTAASTSVPTQSSIIPVYNPSDWLSDINPNTDNEDEADTDNEDEQRWELIKALKGQGPTATTILSNESSNPMGDITKGKSQPVDVSSSTTDDKLSFREQHQKMVQELAEAARQVRSIQQSNVQDIGREFYMAEEDDGIVEEAIREYEAATQQQSDSTFILLNSVDQTLNKKKELTSNESGQSHQYAPFQKNIYRVSKSVAALTPTEVTNCRAKLRIRVRGVQAPAPVLHFHEMGLPESVLQYMTQQHDPPITTPYPIQAQCIPCILAGRDVIGIAKTGSGKTLAYVLPMLRHIIIQPPLQGGSSTNKASSSSSSSSVPHRGETGPIALILVPARELAFQIHSVCKPYAKLLGLKSTAIYGGAGVAEQIADLKRGTHIVTATPGRLIDILTMQSGKLFSLNRVTYVVMDEADRMYDMGFAPQISAIIAGIRPDRQIVLFSATFPKAIESLARQSLKYPVEVMVGGRSVTSDNVTQYAEVVEESDKFFRLLQILGEQVEGTKKVIVFVDTQVRADSLFEQLLRNGYSTLSLHGGKEQEDRDSTLSDFKRRDGPNVLVATGVAGRGLDVTSCTCVVNFAAPNHLEAYVHQTGRTGRAGNRGVAYTLVNPTDEAKFAPVITRALAEAGQAENIDKALIRLSDEFKVKVEKGEAKYASNGFKGKGYSYDSTEMNESQRAEKLEKRQALIEAGLLDPDEEDASMMSEINAPSGKQDGDDGKKKDTEKKKASAMSTTSETGASKLQIPDTLTPELLALPGMKEALLRRAGIVPTSEQEAKAQEDNDLSLGRPVKTSDNHWVQEFEINDYPREARWKVTQKESTSRLQDEFRTAVTMKGSYVPTGREPGPNERKIYLHLEATSSTILRNAVLEIQRMLNEETLRRNYYVNCSPTSDKLCNRVINHDNQISFEFIDDVIFDGKFISCKNIYRGKPDKHSHSTNKWNEVYPFKFPVKQNNHQSEKEELEDNTDVSVMAQQKKAFYTSPLQAFIQQLLAEQNCASSEILEDPLFIMVPQQPQQKNNGDIPDLQESYTSCTDCSTVNDDNTDRCDSISSVDIDSHEDEEEVDDDEHVKYSDLPPLIDVAREMRMFL